MMYFCVPGCMWLRGKIPGTFGRSMLIWEDEHALRVVWAVQADPHHLTDTQRSSRTKQAEASSWKPNSKPGWRTLSWHHPAARTEQLQDGTNNWWDVSWAWTSRLTAQTKPLKLPASVPWLHLSVHKLCQRGSCKKKICKNSKTKLKQNELKCSKTATTWELLWLKHLWGRCFQLPFLHCQLQALGCHWHCYLWSHSGNRAQEHLWTTSQKFRALFSTLKEKKKKKQTKQPCSALFKLTTKVCGFGFLVYATAKKKKSFKIEVPEYLLLNGPDSLRLCLERKKKKQGMHCLG